MKKDKTKLMRQIMMMFVAFLVLPLPMRAQEGHEVMATYEAGISASPEQGAFAISQDDDGDEYEYRDLTMQIGRRDNDNQYNVTTGAPIVTTSPLFQV